MVAQKFISTTKNPHSILVRSRRGKTYEATLNIPLPKDLTKGDTVFVEFQNQTPTVTGFEDKEVIKAEYEEQRQDVLNLGGDY